jgi:hypothetical protein
MTETEFSDDAKSLMCGLFAFGHGTVTSHPPHATYRANEAAFLELLSAGLITREPFNRFDVWLHKPTERLSEEAAKHRHWYFSRVFPDAPPRHEGVKRQEATGSDKKRQS